ncbi:MAG: hypothetical protein E6J34_20305, partial [Chloroflexi bacterium]
LHHAMADETNRNGKTSRAEHRTLVPPNKVALRSLADPSVHPSRSQWADPTDADQSLPPSSLAGFTQSFSSASSKDVGASVQMLEESHHSARVTPQLEKELVRSLAQILYMQESTIPVETPFVEIGLDSVIGVEWIQSLNKQYASQLKVSSLYDYPTIRQMAGLLARAGLKSQHMPVQSLSPLSLEESEPVETVSHACKAGLTNLQSVARRPQARSEAIAIIGMAGKYPAAPNLTDLWDNLVQGKDAIREIPLERWNPADYYDPHPGTPGKISCKWLGALEGIEDFDPLFFHLSPAEAEEMDPQQRLFLQEGYKAFEDAGYSPLLLSNRKCGIYLGISGSEYGLLLAGHKGTDTSFMGTSPAIAAARLAYLLNLKGPAISIDTACSSSLVATHLACQALRTQEIDMALVGGVSLYLTADSYVSMCGAGMLSPDGRCKSFDSRANGFVPAEGVGALVLKRLADAQADHDHIYGLIIGSGMNQDGTTNGITAPSVKSQIELEREIYESYQIDPASMSYVEMHGTGTKLGDPIELEALATVFSEKTEHKQYCAIGSVKSNIGHTSAAAGLVGVHKVLLQMLHKKLVPTLHFAQPNPHFAFEASPFYVNTELRDWKRTSGTPLRAAVSSFGMSGTNVHVVIEEYLASEQATSLTSAPTPSLFVLSANSEPQLQSYAREMRLWIQAHVEQALSDIAYTCQVGRQDMEYRLAIVADTREVLLQRLEAFVDGHPSTQVHTGQVKRRRPGTSSDLISSPDNGTVLFEEDSDAQSLLLLWYQKKKLDKIAQAWVRGITIDWKLLSTAGAVQTPSSLPTASALPQRVSLPTYPFARESYWVAPPVGTGATQGPSPTGASVIHPLVQRNTSTLWEQQFRSTFHGEEFFLADHVILVQRIMPAVAYLEMAVAAVREAIGDEAQLSSSQIDISHVVWLRPLIVEEHPVTVRITLDPLENGTIAFVIRREEPEEETEEHIYCQGRILVGQAHKRERPL